MEGADDGRDNTPVARPATRASSTVASSRYNDITHVTAERNYVRVFFKDGTSTRVRAGIAQWQLMLADRGAARLSRSLIINLAAIEQVQRVARDLTLVTLVHTPRPLRLGRRAASQLERVMPTSGGRRANGEGGKLAVAPAVAQTSAEADVSEIDVANSAGNVSR